MGVPIHAVADGVVELAHDTERDLPLGSPVDLKARANYIKISHGEITSFYGHIKRGSAKVKIGQQVKRGQQIAEIGNSGISTQPHLHFSMKNKKGITVPPQFSNLKAKPKHNSEKFVSKQTLEVKFEYFGD